MPAAAAAIPPFAPSEDLAAQILDSIASPDFTLRDIAVEANTTLEALVLWLASPEIAERLSNLESAIARRTRLVATNTLPFVAKTLSLIIEEHNREESKVPHRTDSLKHLEQRRRARETARRAGSLLLRLAKFEPGPARWHRSPTGVSSSPSQREGAGGGLRTSDWRELVPSYSPSLGEGAGGRVRSGSDSLESVPDGHAGPIASSSPPPTVSIPLTTFISLFAAPRQRIPITRLEELAPSAAQSAGAADPDNGLAAPNNKTPSDDSTHNPEAQSDLLTPGWSIPLPVLRSSEPALAATAEHPP